MADLYKENYATFCSFHPRDIDNFKRKFLDLLPRLDDEIWTNLEAPIAVGEVD